MWLFNFFNFFKEKIEEIFKTSIYYQVVHPGSFKRNYQVAFEIVLPELFNSATYLGNGNINFKKMISENIDLEK